MQVQPSVSRRLSRWAMNKGINLAAMPEDMYQAHVRLPEMHGFSKSEGDWFW
jgi:hypothetical protein